VTWPRGAHVGEWTQIILPGIRSSQKIFREEERDKVGESEDGCLLFELSLLLLFLCLFVFFFFCSLRLSHVFITDISHFNKSRMIDSEMIRWSFVMKHLTLAYISPL
jgi:hypothetical protein